MTTSETQGGQASGDIGVSPSPDFAPVPLVRALVVSLAVAAAAAIASWFLANSLRLNEVVNLHEFWGGSRLSVERATRNGAIAYASIGAILSAGLGICGALTARRLSSVGLLVGVLSGLGLGALAGGASCYPLFPWFFAHMEQMDLRVAILTHLGIWSSIGAAAGVAFGLGTGRREIIARAIVGGITGAALATLVFEITGLLFPFAHTERPLAETALTRLAANSVLALCVAVGIVVVSSQEQSGSPKKASQETA